jgi:hypothetical protein
MPARNAAGVRLRAAWRVCPIHARRGLALRRFGLGAACGSAHTSMDMGGISLLGQQGVQGGRDGSNEYCLLVSQNAELS